MHITGGKLRRRTLHITQQKGIRPTSAKVREAIFSMIGQDLNGLSMLDSFGGSGIMGLEAWSRGAEPVLITEKNRRAVNNIRKYISSFQASIEVRQVDASKGLSKAWDLVFLDPPYHMDVRPFLRQAFETTNWTIITETDSGKPLELTNLKAEMDKRGWTLAKQKHYGASLITIFQRSASSSDTGDFPSA